MFYLFYFIYLLLFSIISLVYVSFFLTYCLVFPIVLSPCYGEAYIGHPQIFLKFIFFVNLLYVSINPLFWPNNKRVKCHYSNLSILDFSVDCFIDWSIVGWSTDFMYFVKSCSLLDLFMPYIDWASKYLACLAQYASHSFLLSYFLVHWNDT